MDLRRGDEVVVIAGKEKGKRGKVLRLLGKKDRVVVERLNIVKRHTKPTQASPKGGIIEKEGSIEFSNLSLWCNKCNAARRSRVDQPEGQKKRRVCIKCATAFETA